MLDLTRLAVIYLHITPPSAVNRKTYSSQINRNPSKQSQPPLQNWQGKYIFIRLFLLLLLLFLFCFLSSSTSSRSSSTTRSSRCSTRRTYNQLPNTHGWYGTSDVQ